MSKSFSANQYENAFVSTKIQNWEIPKEPGSTTRQPKKPVVPIVDDRYHLLPPHKQPPKQQNIRKFSNFVGTWDMPKKLPSYKMDVKTGRDEKAFEMLQEEYKIPKEILNGMRLPDNSVNKRQCSIVNNRNMNSNNKMDNNNNNQNNYMNNNNSRVRDGRSDPSYNNDDTTIPYYVDENQLQEANSSTDYRIGAF